MRILKFLAITATLCSYAISPDIKINVFGGHGKRVIKMNDPFISKENEDFYIEYDGITAPTKENHQDKHDGHAFFAEKDHEGGKKDGFGLYDKAGIAFGGSIEAVIVNNSYFFGLNVGALFFAAQPKFNSSLHVPSKAEATQILDKAIADLTTQIGDPNNKKEKKPLETRKSELEKWKEKIDNDQDTFFQEQERTVVHSITVQKGLLFFAGPTIGMFLSDNLAFAVDLNVAATKTTVEINDQGKIHANKFDMNIGVMPVARLSWYASEKLSLFVAGGCIIFVDAAKLPPNKLTAQQKDDKPKDPAKAALPKTPSDNKDDLHGANKITWLATVGVTFQIK